VEVEVPFCLWHQRESKRYLLRGKKK